jgi:hypothetical protein
MKVAVNETVELNERKTATSIAINSSFQKRSHTSKRYYALATSVGS